MSGTLAGTGSFRCEECGYVVTLAAADALPDCPGCGGSAFRRASLFGGIESGRFARTGPVALEDGERADWLVAVRERVDAPGEHLAYEDDGEIVIFALEKQWTRIGRSLAADVRFDDPTVSRRHALLVRQADGVRVLDDRSLNGVFVNGERVDWRPVKDGDEIVVGRHRLTFLEAAAAPAGSELEEASA
jgi:predicted  nucleic acid-binding Zn-ribbon protein